MALLSIIGCKQPELGLQLGAPADHVLFSLETRETLPSNKRTVIDGKLSEGCKVHSGYASDSIGTKFRITDPTKGRNESALFEATVAEPKIWHDAVISIERDLTNGIALEIDAAGANHESVWQHPFVTCPDDDVRRREGLKNVILISLDTLRADRLGVAGYERNLTPNLDKIARAGVRASRAFSTYGTTLASHASVFTGEFPARLGGGYRARVRPGQATLTSAFRDAGYTTAAFTEDGYIASVFGFKYGFQRYHDGPRYFDHALDIDASQTFARGLEWLAERPETPFFLFLHTYDVHTPYTPNRRVLNEMIRKHMPGYRGYRDYESLRKKYKLSLRSDLQRNDPAMRFFELLYDAEVKILDERVGVLFEKLDELGALESTIVVIMSDHGEAFAEHSTHGHGKTLAKEVYNVPLIFYAPGTIPADRIIDRTVSLVDLAPTIAELAGLGEILTSTPAKSLAPAIMGDDAYDFRPAYSELGQSIVACKIPPARLRDACPYDGVAVRDDRFTYIHSAALGKGQLYDVRSDPKEEKDISLEFPKISAHYRTMANEYRKRFSDSQAGGDDKGIAPATHEKLEALGYLQ